MKSLLVSALTLALMALPAATRQLANTYGPVEAPIGCNVYYSLQNAGSSPVTYDPCGFAVYDASGVQVYVPACPGSVIIHPGQSYDSVWPQTDQSGQQVPPGLYHLQDPNGPTVTVGGAQAAVAPLGTRNFELCSPQDGGRPYLMGAALSSPMPMGFTACGLSIPLSAQAFSLTLNDSSVFQGFVGFLDANGVAQANLAPPPTFVQPALVDYAFVVFDFTQACPLRRVSAVTRTPFL